MDSDCPASARRLNRGRLRRRRPPPWFASCTADRSDVMATTWSVGEHSTPSSKIAGEGRCEGAVLAATCPALAGVDRCEGAVLAATSPALAGADRCEGAVQPVVVDGAVGLQTNRRWGIKLGPGQEYER